MPFHGEGSPAARCTVGRGGGGGETHQELVWGVAEEEAGPVRSRFGSEEDGRLAARSSISAIRMASTSMRQSRPLLDPPLDRHGSHVHRHEVVPVKQHV